jgi:DNA-directed RNA polymerase subunit RPC12/RpoP
MQLQVECSNTVGKQQVCQICNRSFEMQAAQVMVCDDQGSIYGNVCPECISRGFGWLNSHFKPFR